MSSYNIVILLLASLSDEVFCQSLPGCPPPISSFISYPEKVTVPKISPFKVATLQFRENSYFGSARCSLVQDLTDKKEVVLKSFRLEESSLKVRNSKVKTCTVFLMNDKLKENVLDIEVILIVTLNEGYRRFCQSNSIISSTASIEISFCDPEQCHDRKTGWEILGNVVSYKNGRSVDSGDSVGLLTQTLEITGGQGLSVEADTRKRDQEKQGSQDSQEEVRVEAGSVTVGQGPDSDVNNKIILGLALVVTLIALSLILGLIYFWCPALCCCMSERSRGKVSLDSTKILTVRDAQGKVIEDAKSVEVWKMQANTIRTLEVLDNKSARRYSRLPHSDPSSGTLTRSSNFLTDSVVTRSLRSQHSKTPVKIINVSENLDGLIILRKSDQTRNSRVTLLEELNPRRLVIEREADYDQDRARRLEYQETDRGQSYESYPESGRRLSFSRHYSARGAREAREGGSPMLGQIRPRWIRCKMSS